MALATPKEMSSGKVEFTFPVGVTPRYMSWCGDAWSPRRTHGRLADAKNSLRNRAGRFKDGKWVWKESYILEMVGGKWFVLYHIPDDTVENDLPWMVEKIEVSYETNPNHKNYNETPNERKFVRVERTHKVRGPMNREEYAEWRVAVDRELRGA